MYTIKISKNETVKSFCDRFDSLIKEHELSDDQYPITPQEKRSAFYQAIIGVMPEIRRTDSSVVQVTGKEMTLEALKQAMRRIELE